MIEDTPVRKRERERSRLKHPSEGEEENIDVRAGSAASPLVDFVLNLT